MTLRNTKITRHQTLAFHTERLPEDTPVHCCIWQTTSLASTGSTRTDPTSLAVETGHQGIEGTDKEAQFLVHMYNFRRYVVMMYCIHTVTYDMVIDHVTRKSYRLFG